MVKIVVTGAAGRMGKSIINVIRETAGTELVGSVERSGHADIGKVAAPNISVGVNLLLKVVSDMAKILGKDYDVEIIEAHNRLKKDAPSGTAMRLAEVLAYSLN